MGHWPRSRSQSDVTLQIGGHARWHSNGLHVQETESWLKAQKGSAQQPWEQAPGAAPESADCGGVGAAPAGVDAAGDAGDAGAAAGGDQTQQLSTRSPNLKSAGWIRSSRLPRRLVHAQVETARPPPETRQLLRLTMQRETTKVNAERVQHLRERLPDLFHANEHSERGRAPPRYSVPPTPRTNPRPAVLLRCGAAQLPPGLGRQGAGRGRRAARATTRPATLGFLRSIRQATRAPKSPQSGPALTQATTLAPLASTRAYQARRATS